MQEKNLLFTLSDSLTKKIYKSTLIFPHIYQSSIGDQLRRSSLSVVLNIVEGGARQSVKERAKFTQISYSSLKETKYLVYFAKELAIINSDLFYELNQEISRLALILYGLLYKKRSE